MQVTAKHSKLASKIKQIKIKDASKIANSAELLKQAKQARKSKRACKLVVVIVVKPVTHVHTTRKSTSIAS